MRYAKSLFTKHSEIEEYLKNQPILRYLQILQANNSRILKIKKMKFSGYCFYMNTNIKRDFQICISVPFSLVLI